MRRFAFYIFPLVFVLAGCVSSVQSLLPTATATTTTTIVVSSPESEGAPSASIIETTPTLIATPVITSKESVPSQPSPTPKLITTLTPDSQSKTIKLIDQIGGENKDIAVQDHYVYLGVGPRLLTFDISDPTQPFFVGQTDVLTGLVQEIIVAKNMAYILSTTSLHIIDISSPMVPVEIGHYELTQYICRNCSFGLMAVKEDIVYISTKGGILIIDATIPSTPQEVTLFNNFATKMIVLDDDNLAYIASKDGFGIVDLSNPKAPIEVSLDPTIHVDEMAIKDDIAFMVSTDNKLFLFDISESITPKQINSLSISKEMAKATDMSIIDDVVYLFNRFEQTLSLIDVSNVSNLNEIGIYKPSHPILSISIVKETSSNSKQIYAYVGWGGLGIVDLSDPANPIEVGNYPMLGEATDVGLVSNGQAPLTVDRGVKYAYVTCGKEGICIFDISNPTHTTLAKFYNTPGQTNNITIIENTAYVEVGGGFRILDVSTPTVPQEINSYPYSGPIEVVGQRAYIAANKQGALHILDISNPAMPDLISVYQPDNFGILDVAVNEDKAYLASQQGLQVIDVSDPIHPKEISTYLFPTEYPLDSVVFIKNIVYMTGYRESVHIINVSNPFTPKEVGTYEAVNWGSDLAISDNLAYFYTLGYLCLADFSNLIAPKDIDCYKLSEIIPGFSESNNVTIIDDIIYVATRDEGLWILSTTVN